MVNAPFHPCDGLTGRTYGVPSKEPAKALMHEKQLLGWPFQVTHCVNGRSQLQKRSTQCILLRDNLPAVEVLQELGAGLQLERVVLGLGDQRLSEVARVAIHHGVLPEGDLGLRVRQKNKTTEYMTSIELVSHTTRTTEESEARREIHIASFYASKTFEFTGTKWGNAPVQ